ncbi:hypothetical protein [Pseudomonas aeruginosa]|jgi:hypothetical protein|uniref:hypothetical protein n=1 Tax=Pseudomonas aeruginosa TaxID=287 RepID=UPI000B5A3B95|nr:hypothetical protein [Pseudomonas aeruginosa]ASJ88503.1 hypothetical protein PSA83_06377 [Pseudomonas aeruginosa]MBO8337242.1 hypothetical protein [Pseudomonas aeruginosa]HCF4079447.1 hypothetical protein [Pseudomonas aeruginosa]HDV6122811.1 hypothetical protein [Pseudomonas aeruginosa]HDV6143689.1 hypothetical protein [Pseudomonas aeruginosa]
MSEFEQRKSEAVSEALDAFWTVIAQKFPEATTGDLDPGTVFLLEDSAEKAVNTWVKFNV